jgi:hypothetical protein
MGSSEELLTLLLHAWVTVHSSFPHKKSIRIVVKMSSERSYVFLVVMATKRFLKVTNVTHIYIYIYIYIY